ncbi:MAG: hypothetical protein EZS28_053150, partial [Streblomastix strix]
TTLKKEIIEKNKNLKEEFSKIKKLNDERICTILNVSEESPKDVRTPIRASAVIEQSYAEVRRIVGPSFTHSMYYSSSSRNKTGKYGPTSKLRKKQIISAMLASMRIREIPTEYQKVGYTDTHVVQITDYNPAVPTYYKLFSTALNLEMEAFLFDKCRIVSDEEIQLMKQRYEAKLIRRKIKRK